MTTTTPEQAKAPLPPNPKTSKRRIRVDLRQYGILAALVVIIVLFQILTEGRLLYPGNVSNLIQQNAYVLILAIGKGIEKIELVEISENDDHRYFRKDGIHYGPKVRVEDLIIG